DERRRRKSTATAVGSPSPRKAPSVPVGHANGTGWGGSGAGLVKRLLAVNVRSGRNGEGSRSAAPSRLADDDRAVVSRPGWTPGGRAVVARLSSHEASRLEAGPAPP